MARPVRLLLVTFALLSPVGVAAQITLSSMPMLQIGSADGKEPYLLSRVRAAIRLDDGRIVVANGGSAEIRIYDAKGTFQKALGRRGQGPGEFDNLTWIAATSGGTIAAWDSPL